MSFASKKFTLNSYKKKSFLCGKYVSMLKFVDIVSYFPEDVVIIADFMKENPDWDWNRTPLNKVCHFVVIFVWQIN